MAQGIPFATRIACVAEMPDRALARGDRLDLVVGCIQRVGQPRLELGPLGGWLGRGEPQGACVLGRRLAVRTDRRGAARGDRRQMQHGSGVVRSLGVMGQPGRVDAPGRIAQRGQQRAVQAPPAGRPELGLDRHPGQLVAEARPAVVVDQHSAGQALVQRARSPAADRLERPWLERRGRHRHRFQHRSGVLAHPRGTGVDHLAHGRGHLLAARLQHLVHVERVAAGQPVELGRVQRVPGCHLADGLGRQRIQRHPPEPVRGGEVAEQHAHRMHRPDGVVAVGEDDQHVDALDPPAEHAQHVERRLVRPVHVLDHQH